MKGRIGLLSGLLAVQLLIVAGLLLRSGLGSDAQAERFLAFAPAEVAKLRVSDADGSVVLLRTADAGGGHGVSDGGAAPAGGAAQDSGGDALGNEAAVAGDDDAGAGGEADEADAPGAGAAWRLESGLPADNDKVNDLLDKLAELAAPWPVATSADSAERFAVTEDNYQRRLVLEDAEDVVADVFLGTSPGYRRVHARVAGQDEVYSIDFSNYEAPTDVDQWLDKGLLAAAGDPSSIVRQGAWRLAQADGAAAQATDAAAHEAEPAQDAGEATEAPAAQWLIDGAPADSEEADRIVRRFKDLRVVGAAEAAGESKAVFLVVDGGGEHRLELFHEDEGDQYSISSSRLDGRFELAAYIAEQMLVDASDLLPGAEDADEASSGDAGGEEGSEQAEDAPPEGVGNE